MSNEVVYKNDFSQGLGGITGLVEAGNGMDKWPQLSQEGVVSPYAMLLDTQEGSNEAATGVVRLGLIKARLRATYIVGVTSPSSVDNNSFRNLRFWIDTQEEALADASGRHWHEVRYRHWDETDAEVVGIWEVQTGTTSSFAYTETGHVYELGYNQRYKANARKIVIDWDLIDHNYLFLRTGTEGKNLRSLAGPDAETKISEPGTYFNNSMNFGITVEGRTNNTSSRVQARVHLMKVEVV